MDAESMASFEKLNDDDDDDDSAEVFVSSLVLPFGVVSSLWGNADETNSALNRFVVVEAFAAAALRKEEEGEEEDEEDANLDANEREEYAFMPVDASIVCVCACVFWI
jgi:hypothetical protein